jgi:hypothetical protein
MATLLVDDEKTFDVDKIARTFDEGILALQSTTWDILFLDHDLGDPDPNKTGYGICCWLERHPEHRPQKVVLVTNNGAGRDYMVLALRKMYPEDYR